MRTQITSKPTLPTSLLTYALSTLFTTLLLTSLSLSVHLTIFALSRSLFSRLIPAGKNAEFFGFYGLAGKFAAIFGPFVFGLVGQLSGSSRMGIVSLAFFFLAGILILLFVNPEKGKAEAMAAALEKTAGPSAVN